MTYGRAPRIDNDADWVQDEDGNVLGYMKDPRTFVGLPILSAAGNGIYLQPAEFDSGSYLAGIAAQSVGGRFTATAKPDDLIDTSSWTQTYYVDGVGGNDSNSGATWALRKKSIGNAMRAASSSGLPSRILVWAQTGLPYYRQIGVADDSLARQSTVPILLESMNGRIQTGPFDNLTWSKTGGLTYTYQATRSGGLRCVNPSLKDNDGMHTEYKWAASSAAVDALEGSWFTDGTTVYVRPHGNIVPTVNSARVYLNDVGFVWQSSEDLVVRGFDFEGGKNGAIWVRGGSSNTIAVDSCTFRYSASSNLNSGGVTVIDGVQVLGCGLFAGFNSSADRNSKDGFNFHIESSILPTALLVNCSGTLNGLNPSSSNNGFTCHDGVKAISIGCDWRGNYGTGSGHVSDGTQVWSVGDISGASMGDVIYGGSIVYGGFATWSGNAKIWLDSCRDVGAQYGVFQEDTAEVYLRNHTGSGLRTGVIGSY